MYLVAQRCNVSIGFMSLISRDRHIWDPYMTCDLTRERYSLFFVVISLDEQKVLRAGKVSCMLWIQSYICDRTIITPRI